ncbi:hypothetical protein AB3S75_031264 [Citrus x aurantiifolia]
METNGSNSNSHENQHPEISNDACKDSSTEKLNFINHAEIAWHERRRQWFSDQFQKRKRMPREPIMGWTTTYVDLLCSTDPFHQPIPLAEMVDLS